MQKLPRAAALAAALALIATPALATGPPDGLPPANQGTEHKPATPGPSAGLPEKAKAYGRRCADESRRRTAEDEGLKGTAFSRCVTAMARLAHGDTSSPRKACRDLSRKRVDGERGTQFSRCVNQGTKLLRQQRAND